MTEQNQIQDFMEGQEFSFLKQISPEEVDAYAKLSGDMNSLHMDVDFAKERGFEGRVVHGGLLIGYLSKLVGMHLPGENCLLQRVSVNFHAPCYINDTVKITGVIDQISVGTDTMVIEVKIEHEGTKSLIAKGKIHVGFTKPKK